uniref:GG11163 n=2 Tax=Drosophila erecta TaxID=7220 RepID=B3P8K0_DROER
MRRAAKRENEDPHPKVEPQSPCSWPNSTLPSEWGTSGGSQSLGPRALKAGENPLKDSRIFHVLWRNQTTKKHKTWTGNGTLVVTGSVVTLKDDTGKVVDTMTCFRQRELRENDQLEVGSRDVEVQEEIKTVEECFTQRQLEIDNWCQKIDAQNGYADTSSPLLIARAPFKKIKSEADALTPSHMEIVQHKMKHVSYEAPTSGTSHVLEKKMCEQNSLKKDNPPMEFTQSEFLCLLAPAELQKRILIFLSDYAETSKVKSPLLKEVVRTVCDHPVLLKTLVNKTELQELMEVLDTILPPWPDMGLYDSAKFEFLHVMLDNLVAERGEKCCILANSEDCLTLVRGYCQSYSLDHAQLDGPKKVDLFNSLAEGEPMVGLILTSDLSQLRALRCKHLIIYNLNAREHANKLLAVGAMDTTIYTLITAGGSTEELQFYSQMAGNTDDNLADWTAIEPPFDCDFFEETAISDSLDCIQRVYSRKIKVKT